MGGWHSHGAMAIACSGTPVAAVEAGPAVGMRHAGLNAPNALGLAMESALRAAGAAVADLTRVVLVSDTVTVCGTEDTRTPGPGALQLLGLDAATLCHATADEGVLQLARGAGGTDAAIAYAGEHDAWLSPTGAGTRVDAIVGYRDVCEASALLGSALGCRGSAWLALSRLATGAPHDPQWRGLMRLLLRVDDHLRVRVDSRGLGDVLRQAAESVPVPLHHADTPHVAAQELRAALAAGWLEGVGDALRQVSGDGHFGGAVGTLRPVAGPQPRLPWPDARGAVLGEGASVPGAMLGETFDESAIKQALESARLDYLYEPSWPRLVDRVSSLLEAGKLVAWFQGRGEFGDIGQGNRAILADPSNRYCRDNVNQYLRRRPVTDTLPVMVHQSRARALMGQDSPADGYPVRTAIVPAHAAAFQGATDSRGEIDLICCDEQSAPACSDVLTAHAGRTGIPGLVVLPLEAPGRPVAVTPLDALAVMFTTPVDALVIGRFLLMKDYWLLRSGTAK